MTRILIADDDPAVLEALEHALRRESFEVDTVTDGEAALEASRSREYDLVLLNVMMPRLFGTDVVRELRLETAVPIVLLTSLDATEDVVAGFELGADDYVTKPFTLEELKSRLKAILRRRDLDFQAGGGIRRVGRLEIDLARNEVNVEGQPVRLTRSEFMLLALLADAQGRPVSREDVLRHLWQSTYVGDERSVDIHVSNLRHKLAVHSDGATAIETVRGVGYRLVG